MLGSRQFLPFFAISLLLASALVFIPASAASSLSITVDADHNEYSFASVNGTASFVVTITNDGDDDFTNVAIDSSFDELWDQAFPRGCEGHQYNEGGLALRIALKSCRRHGKKN